MTENYVDKPYKCASCDRKFSLKFEVSSHILSEHVQNPHEKENLHECLICDCIFTKKRHLAQHVSSNHKCSVCNFTFSKKSILKVHFESNHEVVNKCIMELVPDKLEMKPRIPLLRLNKKQISKYIKPNGSILSSLTTYEKKNTYFFKIKGNLSKIYEIKESNLII